MHPDDSAHTIAADLVVIGSGAAGLSASLAAAAQGARVVLLTGGDLLSGSSPWAQGGVAAALGPDDSLELHAADTMAVGAGVNDAQAVGALVREGRDAVRDLLVSGVPFDGSPAHPDLGLEAGHSRRRILHRGGATGHAITTWLLAQAAAHPCITIHPHTPADALVTTGGRATGARSGQTVFAGRAVILASGGYAALWGRTTNPIENRGAGLALAWWAGASLADLEFVQFHPTALSLPNHPAFLLSEALRGEGAVVVDTDERPIVDPLLPRDVVARAIAGHLRERGPVYLSLRHLDAVAVRARFPTIAARLREWGLDLTRDLLPIAPAAHYCMGGVRTDDAGRTGVRGLYAAGEVACTGAQGANRLASNSLLECLAFGRRAAHAALHDGTTRRATWPCEPLDGPLDGPDHYDRAAGVRDDARHERTRGLGARLDDYLGVERDAAGLATLVATLPDPLGSATMGEIPATHLVAALAARAALLRTESRGAHYRGDTPRTLSSWRGRIHWRRGAAPRFERITA